MISLEKAKNYLRVTSSDDDELIMELVQASDALCMDILRTDEKSDAPLVAVAKLYTLAYLYEHREDANHEELMQTVRALLSGIRKEVF